MRLRTKLVLATSVFTLLLTAALCSVFFSELLRGRIAQAAASNDVLTHELLLSVRSALVNGLANSVPTSADEAGFEDAVAETLERDPALRQTMNAIVSYSLTVQDVSVTGANGQVLVSTDPALLARKPPVRRNFDAMSNGSVRQQWEIVFGRPEVLDVALPLQRNGGAFLYAHIGVRSTLLRAVLAPWLREAAVIGALALMCSLGAAVLLSSLAVRPIERISQRLEQLSRRPAEAAAVPVLRDPEKRASSTIAEIDERIRFSEQQATGLGQMLQTLKDGMLLVEGDGTIAMMSASVRNFLPEPVAVGSSVFAMFAPTNPIVRVLQEAFRERQSLREVMVALTEERDVELSLDFGEGGSGPGGSGAAGNAMLTLHDAAAREEIEREIEVARRLASIGKLTAGVGHEVKNPIHAMVLHLELLRTKLAAANAGDAGRHVEVLATEMARLDRVVQTLADFSKPMEPMLRELPLRPVVDSVLQLVGVDAARRAITITVNDASRGAMAVVDREMLHQALLNMMLNAMDAIEGEGEIAVSVVREQGTMAIGVRDTGKGIAPEALERIFHLYFTTKPGGSGIGLAMTWRMVQMMGGTIEVESNPHPDSLGRGTLFVVRLPLATRPGGNAPRSGLPQTPSTAATEVRA